MDQVPHIDKKPIPAVILTVNGVRVEGLAYIPLDYRLVDELAASLRPYIAVGQPKITFPDSPDPLTPIVAFVPKEQVHLAWIAEQPEDART